MPKETRSKCCERCACFADRTDCQTDFQCICHTPELPSEPKECKCICHKGINPYQKQENWSRAGHSPQLCFCHHKQRLEKIVDKVNQDQRKFMEEPEHPNKLHAEREKECRNENCDGFDILERTPTGHFHTPAEKGLDWEVVLKLGDICLGTIIDESVGEPIWKMPRDKMIELFRTAIKKAEQAARDEQKDKCGKFSWEIDEAIQAERNRCVGILEGMKRTDENQMNEDHIYDDALSEAIKAIESTKE